MNGRREYNVIIVTLLLTLIVKAQNYSVKGRVLDKNQIGIDLATVQIFSDTVLRESTISDKLGNFSFSLDTAGGYQIEISHFNYASLILPVRVSRNGELYLGNIILQESIMELEEMEVFGQKLAIERTLDKIKINIQESILGSGGTVIDLLRQLPIVQISADGELSIRGKSDIQILIDGKPSGLGMLQGQSFLNQIDLSTVESVEIITNPSVDISTTGSGGVINLIKKKVVIEGFKGFFNSGLGSDNWHHFSPRLNFKKGDINLILNSSIKNRRRIGVNENFRNQSENGEFRFIQIDEKGIQDDKRYNFEFGTDYFINEKDYLTVAANYRNRNKKDVKTRNTLVQDIENIIQESRIGRIEEPENNSGWGTTIRYFQKKDENNELSVLLDYEHSVEDENILREEIVSLEGLNNIDGVKTFYVDINNQVLLDVQKKAKLKNSTKIRYGGQINYRKIKQTFFAEYYDEFLLA